MKTFIALTFTFLAFALYEMSGGNDFIPASARKPIAAPVVAEKEPVREPVTATTSPANDPGAHRDTLNLTSVDTSTPERATEAAPKTKVEPQHATGDAQDIVAETQPAAPEPAVSTRTESARILDSSETPQIILPSLIATTPDPEATAQGDIRVVSGNRVNVRGGPDTSYGVVGKLGRGDEVRILDDTGDGWVLMEAIDGTADGWIADFLLTSG